MNHEEFSAFLAFYYRAPDPARAPEALAYFVASPLAADESSRPVATYFFRRIAQDHPELAAGYLSALGGATLEGRRFVRDLLEAIKATPRGTANILEREIRTPTDNNLHWAEFFLIGSPEPLRRLIDVLERPDLVRDRLEAWMASCSLLGGDGRRQRTLGKLRAELGIACDLTRAHVETEEDLDCRVVLDAGQMSRERFETAMRLLPFPLSRGDRNHILVKASAKWSLTSNARQHRLVLEVCEEATASRSGRGILALHDIARGIDARMGDCGYALVAVNAVPTPPGSLAIRALLAVALLVGFYVLAVGVAAALAAIPLLEFYLIHRVHFQLALPCLGAAALILWSITPRFDRFTAPGPPLLSSDQPQLFAELRRVSDAVGQRMPVEVYLDPTVNAWVAQRGGIMGLGGRRVVVLGLPLLQALTVSQLRAVLAHEFGHYQGGDTLLGPWVYKTRLAITRTLQALEGHGWNLQALFLGYAHMFVRVTHAVSRAQEFAADRLAARIGGARALAEGLVATYRAGLAFGPYVASEVQPVLAAGLLPRLADGFARFLVSPAVTAQLAGALDAEMVSQRSSTYDTHPPLRDRIAVLRSQPPGAIPAEDPRAVSLLNRLSELERELIVTATGDPAFRERPSVTWEEAPEKVWIPRWRAMCAEHAAVLHGLTPASLPQATLRFLETDRAAGSRPTAEEAKRAAITTLGTALAFALHSLGWSVHAAVGEEVRLERVGVTVAPFTVIARLMSGDLPAEEWRRQAETLGIATLDLSSKP